MDQGAAGDVAAVGPAEDAHGELGAAGAHQPRDADDLAGADGQRCPVDDDAAGLGGVADVPVLDPQDLLADLGLPLGVEAVDVSPDHAADDPRDERAPLLLGHAHVDRLDRGAVADDGGGVGDRGDLPELVGDDDAGDAALIAQVADQPEQVLGVVVVQGGGGLVEDQQAHVLRQRLGDLDELLLAHTQLADGGDGLLLQPHALEQLGGAGVGLVPADDAAAALLVAEEDVLRDGEVGDERELLMDDHDPLGLGVVDAREADGAAAVVDLALVGAGGLDA